jgi:type II secretory pathway pseudopilin PulG
MTTFESPSQSPVQGEKPQPAIVRWLVIALVAALVVVGVLAALLVLQSRQSTSPSKASAEVVALLDARIAAMNRGDGRAAGALYTQDGVLDELEGMPYASDGKSTYNTVGRAAIQDRLQLMVDLGLRLEAIGEPIMYGDLVAEPTRFYEAAGVGYGKAMLVFQISPDHQIAHQWMIGWVSE